MERASASTACFSSLCASIPTVMENLLSLHIHFCQLLRKHDWQSQECSAQPLGGLVKDKSKDKEQPHPSPSGLACMSGTEERRFSSCSLTPQTRAICTQAQRVCDICCTTAMSGSRQGRKTKYKHANEQEVEAPQLYGTWGQGSLLGSVAGVAPVALRLARTCLFTNQVTGTHAFPRSTCSLLIR